MKRISKSKSRRGAEMLEFTLSLLPLLMMVFVLLNVAWGIFMKSTLAYAVRAGLRVGITTTRTQAAGQTLTAMVKQTVQDNSLGMLGRDNTDPRWQTIKVHYYLTPQYTGSTALSDVSTDPNGNKPGNIMIVSVQGFGLNSLVPRLFGLSKGVDGTQIGISAISADVIEPSRDVPDIGAAP